MKQDSLRGITLVAIFSIIVGLYFLFKKSSGFHFMPKLIESKQWLILLGIIIDFLYILAGIGMFRRLNWSRNLFVIITLAFLSRVIYSSFYLTKNNMIAQYSPACASLRWLALRRSCPTKFISHFGANF